MLLVQYGSGSMFDEVKIGHQDDPRTFDLLDDITSFCWGTRKAIWGMLN
jgi:hypothetical protein